MIKTASGLYIPASEVAYIKDGYAYLYNGAKIELFISRQLFAKVRNNFML